MNEEALELRRQSLGRNHADTLESESILALDYIELGRLDEADVLLSRVLDAMREQMSSEHSHVLKARRNVTFVNIKQGRSEVALEQYLELHELEAQHLDADHPDALQTIDHIGVIYGLMRRFDASLPWAQLAVEKKAAKLGAQHTETLRVLENLAVTYLQAEHFKEALALYYELSGHFAAHPDPGPDPPISVEFGTATASLHLGQISGAIELIDRGLRSATHDPLYLRVALDFINLPVQHFIQQGDLEECQKSAEMIKSLRLQSIGHLLTAARLRVVVAGLAQLDQDLSENPPGLDASIVADPNADRAIGHSRAAIEHGLSDSQQLLEDRILKSLAAHPDYEVLLASDN